MSDAASSAPATVSETLPEAVVPIEEVQAQAAAQEKAEDPQLYRPKVAILHLERDGVIVEGAIDPESGEGVQELLDQLKAQLKAAPEDRAGDPDPNLKARERAKANGHVLNATTGHCDKCNAANWWALDGHPCEPGPQGPTAAAPAQEEPDGQTDDVGAEVASV